MTKRDILTEALIEIGALDPGDDMGDRARTTAERKFDGLIDLWNAKGASAYAHQFNTYVLTPALAPHTIGPTGTFVVAAGRPVAIEDAGLVLTNVTPNVRRPITVRDKDWWAAQQVKSLSTSIPTDVHYEPTWPNGKLFFWPVPTTAYSVELTTKLLLSALTIDDSFDLPFGYRTAITLTLAEDLVTPMAADLPVLLPGKASEARGIIFGNNRVTPRIATRDAGMPRGTRGKTFNYETREM